MTLIHLIIIDDHKLVRETWSMILNNHEDMRVIADAGTAEEGIELCKQHRPHLVLLDINLPGMSGIDAVPLIRKYAPATKIIAVSLHNQVSYAKRMMQTGASGYITKSSSRDEMIKALREVRDGKKYICDEIKNHLAEGLTKEDSHEKGMSSLSVREIEIIQMIKQGFSSKEIAEAKFISYKTVEVHRYNILRKLNLKNTAALVSLVGRHDFAMN